MSVHSVGSADDMATGRDVLHNHPQDRPTEIFGGAHPLHVANEEAPYLLFPIIPPL